MFQALDGKYLFIQPGMAGVLFPWMLSRFITSQLGPPFARQGGHSLDQRLEPWLTAGRIARPESRAIYSRVIDPLSFIDQHPTRLGWGLVICPCSVPRGDILAWRSMRGLLAIDPGLFQVDQEEMHCLLGNRFK